MLFALTSIVSPLALALVCQAPTATAPAKAGAQAPAPTAAAGAGAETHGLFGPPVLVGGNPIPDAEIQRYLCLGLGNKQVDNARFKILIQEEIDRRVKDGDDPTKYAASPEAVDKELEHQRADFLTKYPTMDFPTEVGRALLSLDLYRSQVEQAVVFDKVFLPENPDDWPVITCEVLKGFGLGDGFLDDARESYAARKERQLKENLPEIPPDDPIIVDVYRQELLTALSNFSVTETDPSKLPADVLMLIDNVPIKVESIWKQIEPHVTPDLVDEAKRFLVLTRLIESDLAARGGKMSFDEFKKAFPKDKRSFEEEVGNHQMLALQVKGFPSMDTYLTHLRLSEIHKKLIEAELKDDAKLMPHLPVVTQIGGAAKGDVEVILCSAYDFEHVRWKPNGWAEAEQKAKALKKQLDEGADWTQTIELQSEFWDPPLPEVGQKPQFGFRFKGKFGEQTRNTLLQYMNESEYRMFLYGPSITDHIFFQQKLNSIDGPFKGPYGFYITRLTSRAPPSRPLDLSEPTHRALVEQYYVQATLNELGRKLLADATAKGTVRGI